MRRVFVEQLVVGPNRLDPRQSHHLRVVLRLGVGDRVELFDRLGDVATGTIAAIEEGVLIEVSELRRVTPPRSVTIASAVPKGERADWLVEKLSELGTTRYIPMRCERSVVAPSGTAKTERWRRIAEESAKQSRRVGVMEIEPLRSFDDCLLLQAERRFIADASGEAKLSRELRGRESSCVCLVGPEGGFSPVEIERASSAGFTVVRLTGTLLRVETAAVVAAAAMLTVSPDHAD